jgi:D-arabinose 1-dehydrogenase-like Zn-dependent alcohol dehydrogenase
VLTQQTDSIPIPIILHKVARIQGIYVGSRADFVEMNKAVSLGQLRPVGEEFHWAQTVEVFARMEEASHFGKMVLSVG